MFDPLTHSHRLERPITIGVPALLFDFPTALYFTLSLARRVSSWALESHSPYQEPPPKFALLCEVRLYRTLGEALPQCLPSKPTPPQSSRGYLLRMCFLLSLNTCRFNMFCLRHCSIPIATKTKGTAWGTTTITKVGSSTTTTHGSVPYKGKSSGKAIHLSKGVVIAFVVVFGKPFDTLSYPKLTYCSAVKTQP